MTRLQQLLVRLAPILFLVVIALVVAACSPLARRRRAARPTPSPTLSQAPLEPATPERRTRSDLLAWLFTPIFQALFIVLVFFDQLIRPATSSSRSSCCTIVLGCS